MHPYKSLDSRFFWSSAVAQCNMFDIVHLWDPKFRIRKGTKVSTYGSCFAQHIGNALSHRGFNWMITEPAPPGLSEINAKKFNYNVFSSRTGNIYTVSLLNQWIDWAAGDAAVPDEIWEKEGRFYDPFRPNIEPKGFSSEEELKLSREMAIDAFKRSITDASVFVFTLGLTESWINKTHGYEYPMCPGTIAGKFDPEKHEFLNQDFFYIEKTLRKAIHRMRMLNPTLKFILTVSPVPLTATMSGNHVLIATMESKSILRSVASTLKNKARFIDYFPSYEIINSTPYRGVFFEPNLRGVNKKGVNHVMDIFFNCLSNKFPELDYSEQKNKRLEESTKNSLNLSADDVVCEEELLGAFGGDK